MTTAADDFDVIRVGLIVTGFALVVFTGWAVVINKQPFDALSFGGGSAAIFAGGGFGIAAKVKDEGQA
ncbi:hypothetical protein [Caulobacter sp.]|uniref:hypothetical protein n=1 Tax=Caulobacter sp. TaxID=78 RepID=UPI0031D05916